MNYCVINQSKKKIDYTTGDIIETLDRKDR